MYDRRTEIVYWDAGISTRFAKKLSARDIKEFIEDVLKVKCGRVCIGKDELSNGVRFDIKRMSFVTKFLNNNELSDNGCIVQYGKGVFVAYDFNFHFIGERFISDVDKQAWIDFMIKKFGNEYEQFMYVYTNEK